MVAPGTRKRPSLGNWAGPAREGGSRGPGVSAAARRAAHVRPDPPLAPTRPPRRCGAPHTQRGAADSPAGPALGPGRAGRGRDSRLGGAGADGGPGPRGWGVSGRGLGPPPRSSPVPQFPRLGKARLLPAEGQKWSLRARGLCAAPSVCFGRMRAERARVEGLWRETPRLGSRAGERHPDRGAWRRETGSRARASRQGRSSGSLSTLRRPQPGPLTLLPRLEVALETGLSWHPESARAHPGWVG